MEQDRNVVGTESTKNEFAGAHQKLRHLKNIGSVAGDRVNGFQLRGATALQCVELRVLDSDGSLGREHKEQVLCFAVEEIEQIGLHVEDADNFVAHDQRHSVFRARVSMADDITRELFNVGSVDGALLRG